MELLKTFRKCLLFVLLLGTGANLSAQNFQATAAAFKASYKFEELKEYTKAVSALKTVYDEKSYELNLRLGWLTYLAGTQNESLEYYRKAMSLKPYAIEPCLGFAYPASKLGLWNELLSVYNKALSIDPGNTAVNYAKGLLLYNRADFQSAEICFEKIVNLYPFDYDGLHMLAWTKLQLKKTSEARILFQKALLNRPDNASDTEGLSLIQ